MLAFHLFLAVLFTLSGTVVALGERGIIITTLYDGKEGFVKLGIVSGITVE